MSLFNDNLKNINIVQLLVIILVLYLSVFLLNRFDFSISSNWISVVLIAYFAYKLKDYVYGLKDDVNNIFSTISFKNILFIVVLNIFFSYGMLYLTDFLFKSFPSLNVLMVTNVSLMSISGTLPLLGTFISTVILSSICEELVFRGVFLSKLRSIVPTIYAIVITALLFASLHEIGSIVSAFVFGICMAVLYLKSDNILVPIFAHFLNNLFAEMIKLADVNQVLFTNASVVGIVSFLAVISAIILVYILIKQLNTIK